MHEESVSVNAGVVLVARKRLVAWPGRPSVDQILEMTGAGRTQAYEMSRRIEDFLPTLLGRAGRPARQTAGPGDPSIAARAAVGDAIIEYLAEHPGALCGGRERRTYSDGYRRFVVGLADPGQPGEGLTVAELARAAHIPLGTLKDWLRSPTVAEEPVSTEPTPGESDATAAEAQVCPPTQPEPPDAASETERTCGAVENASDQPADRLILNSHLRLILAQWIRWEGSFKGFCKMLRTEHRLPYQDTWIGGFLQSAGLRHRRLRTPVEAPWSSDTFRLLFPGAQWLGDGTSIAVHWEQHIFVFNVEAILDAASNAVVGFSVSDCEDEEALRQAFRAGVETTGSSPLCITLDRRPSNHTEDVVSTIEAEGTAVLAATAGRGQAKAPLEGTFGLLQQSLPALVLTGRTARELARSALMLILLAWFRGRNGRPRGRFNGLSPAEVYARANPTPEQIQDARKWIAELRRRQERARRTREARRDPVRIRLLIQGLAELGIPDERRRLAIALARYSRDAIVRGLATFAAKKEKGTLPSGADPGRYLGGIIRELDICLEQQQIAEFLLAQRIRARDISLEPLLKLADELRSEQPPEALPQAFTDLALNATFTIDFQFWATAAAEALCALPRTASTTCYRSLCRRIAASFKTDRRRREDLIDRLSQAASLLAAA